MGFEDNWKVRRRVRVMVNGAVIYNIRHLDVGWMGDRRCAVSKVNKGDTSEQGGACRLKQSVGEYNPRKASTAVPLLPR